MIIFITFGIKQTFTIISEFILKILSLLPEYYQFIICYIHLCHSIIFLIFNTHNIIN